MASVRATEWLSLPLSLKELCIDTTLRCGQSFRYAPNAARSLLQNLRRAHTIRWRKNALGEYHMCLHGRVLHLRQDHTHLYYRAFFPASAPSQPLTPPSSHPLSPPLLPLHKHDFPLATKEETHSTTRLLIAYLNLSTPLSDLYDAWSSADPNFAAKAPAFAGVRILRQDAWEALICFICSSNNNISRIMLMIRRLCERYGNFLGCIPAGAPAGPSKSDSSDLASIKAKVEEEGAPGDEQAIPFFDFPTPAALAIPTLEAELRALGFGYRARYIAATARMVLAKQAGHSGSWLEELRNPAQPSLFSAVRAAAPESLSDPSPRVLPLNFVGRAGRPAYRNALEEVMAFSGVGPKVADCVALMGLGWGEAVPIDTHVWQIAVRDYKFKGGAKGQAMNKVIYEAVSGRFRELWGEYAGWAHSVLFAADLKSLAITSAENQRVVKQEEGLRGTDGLLEGKVDEVVELGRGKRRVGVKVKREQAIEVGTVKVEEDKMVPLKRTRRGK